MFDWLPDGLGASPTDTSPVVDRSGPTWEVVLRAIDEDGVEIDVTYSDPYCDSATDAIDRALRSWGEEVDVVGLKRVTCVAEEDDCPRCGSGGGGLCPDCKDDADTHTR